MFGPVTDFLSSVHYVRDAGVRYIWGVCVYEYNLSHFMHEEYKA